VLVQKARRAEIETIGGLVTQRFDVVPPDFECALYVDLMRFLEKGGVGSSVQPVRIVHTV